MEIGKEEPGPGVYGRAAQKILQCLSNDKALSYVDIQNRTGLAGEELDDALINLEKLPYVNVHRRGGGKYYLKVASPQPQEWYSIDEAAKYLRVSRRTVYQLVQARQIVSYRLGRGGHRRFRREDLERVMQRENAPAADALSGVEDPVLAELWDNEKDAEYDRI